MSDTDKVVKSLKEFQKVSEKMVEDQSAWFHNQFLKAKIEGTLNAYEIVIREIQNSNNFSDLQEKIKKYQNYYKERLKEVNKNE